MKRTSISVRIWFILGLFSLGLLINSYLETTNTRNAVQSCYEDNVQHIVDAAKGILQHYHGRYLAGELTEEEAKRLALEAISAISYDNGNYIFMGDNEGISISNGMRELVGTNILGMQDPTGLPLVRNLYEVAISGGGFVDYQWPDTENKSELLPKTSYADYFEPWQWTLGSGLNIESLRQDLHVIQEASWINLVLVMLSVGLLALFFIRSVNFQVKSVVETIRKLAGGQGDLRERLPISGGAEVSDVATSYNLLVAKLENMAEQVHREGDRFLTAMQRMQPQSDITLMEKPEQLTLDHLQSMISQICNQAEALEHAHENLKEMAEQDPATGLLSQQAFNLRAAERIAALDPNTPNTLVILAFDQEALTHQTLTERVSMAAGVLRHGLPDHVLACHVAGKGFVYWCSYTDSSEGMRLAMSLQQQMSLGVDGEREQTVSVGMSAVLGGGKSYELMFSEAERALIRAQKEGGNRVYEY